MTPAPPAPDGLRALPGAGLLALLLVLALVNAAAVRVNDFRVFHTAGQRVLRGEALYRAEDAAYPFKYAPVVGLLLAPVGALPLRPAKLLWELGSALALFAFLRQAARLAAPAPTRAANALAAVLLLPYLWHVFSLGQIDGFLLGAIALSDRWADRRPALSGLLWSLTVLTKPPYLVFVAAALVARQGRRLAALVAGLAAGLGLPALVWGWGQNLEVLHAWRAVLGRTTPELFCASSNQSFWAIGCRYLGPGLAGAAAGAAVGTLALAGATAWAVRAAPSGARDTVTSSCLGATALVSPLGWWTNLVALAPLVLGLLATLSRAEAPRWARAVAAAAVAALAGVALLTAEIVPRDTFVFWLNLRHYGLAALAATLAALAVRAPRAYSQPMTTSSM